MARKVAPAKQSTGLSEAREADERERRANSLFLVGLVSNFCFFFAFCAKLKETNSKEIKEREPTKSHPKF